MRKVVKAIPSDSQIGLYSATMNPEFFEVANMFMTNPVNVLVKSEQLTLDGIRQYYINVGEQSNKFITLCDIYKVMRLNQIIIYCNELIQIILFKFWCSYPLEGRWFWNVFFH